MNDLISRQAAIDAIELTDWYHQNKNKDMVSGANSNEHQAWFKAEDVFKALEDLPSVQPEPDWTEITVVCDNCGHTVHAQRVDCNLSVQPEQPGIIRCKDCKKNPRWEKGEKMNNLINRQAAIDALSTSRGIIYPIRAIESLPSVQPERKKGKWIFPYETTTLISHCSECGAFGKSTNNFCPNCGADMREGEE